MARKRVCTSCRVKKIQCDRALPKCDWCMHQNLVCVYDAGSSVVKSRLRHASARNLLERVERVEVALAAARPSFRPLGQSSPRASGGSHQASSASPTLVDSDPSTPSGLGPSHSFGSDDLFYAGHHMGTLVSPDGIPVFSAAGRQWIRLRTGDEPTFRDSCVTDRTLRGEWPSSGVPDLMQAESSQELPDRKSLEYFLSLFSSSHFHMAFPMLDLVLFEDTLDIAYAPGPADIPASSAVARACIFAFMTIMSLCQAEWDSVPPINGDAFAAKACSLMPHALLDISLTSVQTTFMLALYFQVSGQVKQGIVFHSISSRMIFNLGAHSDPKIVTAFMQDMNPNDKTQRARRHLRRYFWILFRIDKSMTIRTGQPPALDDSYCDLRISDTGLEFDSRLSGSLHWTKGENVKVLFQCILQLLVIKSKVGRLLYSPVAAGTTDIELLKTVRELDDEVEQWRQSVPPWYRPSLQSNGRQVGRLEAAEPSLDRRQTLHYGMHINSMYLEYYHLVAVIHEASGRCRDWSEAQSENLEGISSSIAISEEASRSTLMHLDANVGSLIPEASRLTVFFAISAVLNLFRGVLLDPLEVQVERDIQLIASGGPLIRKLRPRVVTVAVESYIESLIVLVGELVRLCRCAVSKAQIECRKEK
ncbi:hypothetical protein GQ53DRAFT_710965 [Thozetella sp. PMI_491]|nr:hypothetical protein GQ53DRAFT_710965 [Thozetella sp. PMI_491]